MDSETQKTLADTALRELIQLRRSSSGDTSNVVFAIANGMQDTSSVHIDSELSIDTARGAAFLAINRLGNKLAEPDASDIGRYWEDAIKSTEAWRGTLAL
jgi:hypothetical protein